MLFKRFGMLPLLVVIYFGGCTSITYEQTYEPDASVLTRMTLPEARRILASFQTRLHKRDAESSFSAPISHVRVTQAGNLVLVDQTNHKVYAFPLKDMKVAEGIRDQYGQVRDAVVYLDEKFFCNVSGGGDQAKRIVDAIYTVQQAIQRGDTAKEESDFQKIAKVYRDVVPKPQLPEAARRFRVQAEGAINDKNFTAAADFYEQALDIAPWWPQGHFDRAVVLGETEEYDLAVVEMKRYLALVPDAPDARAAQDKIYDWERKAGTLN